MNRQQLEGMIAAINRGVTPVWPRDYVSARPAIPVDEVIDFYGYDGGRNFLPHNAELAKLCVTRYNELLRVAELTNDTKQLAVYLKNFAQSQPWGYDVLAYYGTQAWQMAYEIPYKFPSNNYAIPGYQTVKIRELLKKETSKFGYPIRVYHGVTFFSGLALWVPDYWIISPDLTRSMWSGHPDSFMRYIVVRFVGTELSTSLRDSILDMIPGKVDDAIMGTVDLTASVASARAYPVFENFAFYGTIHDWVIARNFDKVNTFLVKRGY